MGTYKVIQDIEAEDKLLGPLTLRQFIYAIIVIVLGFFAFRLATVNIALALPLLAPMAFFGILAAPFSKDQSSEIWLLAKIRFFLKPRRRIWDQSGVLELVTITAPKKIETVFTKNLSQTEVRSRLEALANTIDSRGWAVKNVNVNMFAQPSYVLGQVDSDRLIDPSMMAQEVPTIDIQAVDDMLDVRSNSRAQALDQMIATSTQARKQQVIQRMQEPSPATKPGQQPDYWFLNQSPQAPPVAGMAAFTKASVVRPGQQDDTGMPKGRSLPTAYEEELLDKIHKEKQKPKLSNSHLKTIKPLSEMAAEPKTEAAKPMSNPAIASLAQNDDLNISTIARQAEKAQKLPPDDEVVIKLH